MEDSIKRYEIDKVASEACTRAGAFALLVSVVTIALCASWQERRADQALADYISARQNLVMFLDELQNDKIWQKYVDANPDADQKPFAKLIHSSVTVEQSIPKPDPQSNEKSPMVAESQPPQLPKSSVPNGPTGLTARVNPPTLSVSIADAVNPYELSRIVEFWKQLNDTDLLNRSRQSSNYFNFSISKWVNRRSTFMYANALTGVCMESELEVSPRFFKRPAGQTPHMNDDALLNCVTLRDLKELAQFELPPMSAPSQLGTRIGRDVDLSPGSLPKDPYSASLAAEALLFFSLVYFYAFARGGLF